MWSWKFVSFVSINQKIKLMKKNKNLFTGIILGMCIVIVPLLLMGSTNVNYDDGNGRYQISTTTFGIESENIYETIIDTKTGTIKSRKKTSFRKYY